MDFVTPCIIIALGKLHLMIYSGIFSFFLSVPVAYEKKHQGHSIRFDALFSTLSSCLSKALIRVDEIERRRGGGGIAATYLKESKFEGHVRKLSDNFL